jgi:gamma-glutamyltranspeptidase / glutathione hydrolase
MFAIFWNNKTKKIHGVNGSGRCPSGLNLEKLSSMGFNEQKRQGVYSPLWITVPGCAFCNQALI